MLHAGICYRFLFINMSHFDRGAVNQSDLGAGLDQRALLFFLPHCAHIDNPLLICFNQHIKVKVHFDESDNCRTKSALGAIICFRPVKQQHSCAIS